MNGTALNDAPADQDTAVMDRRRESREPVIGHIWLLDHRTSTVLRCRCVDMSRHGLHLQAPLGYGISNGQSFELCSQLPGQSAPPGMGLIISRRGRVVRSHILIGESGQDDMLDLGLELDDARHTTTAPESANAEA